MECADNKCADYTFGGRCERYLKKRIAPVTKIIEGRITQEP